MHRKWASILTAFLLCFAFTAIARAQKQAGSISGTLTDSSGAVLKGAQVSIPAKSLLVSTDEQGRFFFSGLQPGDYAISVSYIGFQRLTKTVAVNPGSSTTLSLQLQVESEKQTVLVTAGSASAQAEAVNEERAADNLIQVMPVQTITNLPDRNLGDAVGRMASVALVRNEGQDNFVGVRGGEPRLTNVTVDGFNMPSQDPGLREFDFFSVPTAIVGQVVTSKTLQANMDGDGIGGSINLVPKTATDIQTYQIAALGGFSPIENGRPDAQVYGTWGRRFGAGKKLGFIVGGEYDFDGTGTNDVEPTPDQATLANNQTVPWDDAQDIRTYMFHRPRYGVGGSLDYRIKPGHTVFLRYLYTYSRDSGDKSVYTLFDNTPGVLVLNPGNTGCAGTDPATGATAGPCNTPPRYYNQLENARIYSDSVILSGTHVLNNTWYSWSAAVGNGYFGDQPFDSGDFTNTATTSNCRFNQGATKDYFVPQWTSGCFDEINSPQNYFLTDTQREYGHEEQINFAVEGSGAVRWHLGGHPSTFEYGAKFRGMHKYNNQYSSIENYNGAGAGIPMSNFPNQLKQPNYYNGAYKDGYNVWFGAVQDYVNQHPDEFTPDNSDKGVDSANYSLVEHIPAFYVMNTTDFPKGVRLVLGLRAEVTTDGVHNLSFDPNGNATPNKFSGSYYDLLPSASFRFDAGHDSYMRLIYARGVSRPEYFELAEDLSWGTNGNGAYKYTVSFGNPNLKAETGDDIDVLYDHYFKTFGVVSAGYFFKHLGLPPVSTQKVLYNYSPPGAPPVDQNQTYLATYYINAGSAWISGVELQYLQNWTNLPGFLGGLGMNANYSYIGSQTSGITGRSDKPRLLENAPNLFNIGPTYHKGPVSMEMNIGFNQSSIYYYQYTDGAPGGPTGPLGDNYNYDLTRIDVQAGYALPHGFQFVFSGMNLNNEEFGFYYGSPKYDTQREFYQPTYMFGIKWNPAREQ